MNNNPRSNVTTDVSYLSELLTDDTNSHATILIKHDYYSSDTLHGRQLLDSFLQAIGQNRLEISAIYLIDSAVRLISQSEGINPQLHSIIEFFNPTIYICKESIEEYDVAVDSTSSTLCIISAVDFFADISNSRDLLVIE